MCTHTTGGFRKSNHEKEDLKSAGEVAPQLETERLSDKETLVIIVLILSDGACPGSGDNMYTRLYILYT